MDRRRVRGFIRPPSKDEVRQLAASMYYNLTDDETDELTLRAAQALSLIDRIDDLPQTRYDVKYPRTPGYRPTPEEDPLNLFVTKCEIKGAPTGKLAGKRVAVKDNIAVAGVPMTAASRAMIGYVPDFDAVVVERLLDAGATIVGKLNQDDMSSAGVADTSGFGPARNPANPEYSSGGSSSGSGAVVLAGEADLSLGVDQAGSARIPAAWTGTCAIKATHGLVPSFGIFYIDHSFDFIGPTARDVEGVALGLDVIGGDDHRDPQWVRGPIVKEEYSSALHRDISGLRIGVLKEGFGWDVSEADVDEAVSNAVGHLEGLGASVREVSLPMWRDGWAIWMAVGAHSYTAMVESDQQGYFHKGLATPSLAEAFGKARRTGADHFPPHVKLIMIVGKYLMKEYFNSYFAKGQNLRRLLTQQIDTLLEEVDVLVTPTTPMKAIKLLESGIGTGAWVERAGMNIQNTSPLDLSGHPAITVPCAIGENNLPIGLQIFGRPWAESLLFGVAHTYEQSAQVKVSVALY